MKQIRSQKIITNAHIGPWLPSMPKTNQDMIGIEESLSTNTAIVKDFVRKEKQTRLKDFNEKIFSIPDYVSTSEYWNKLKNSTKTTSEIIQNATKDGFKESRKPISKFRKSVKEMFSRNQYHGEKDLKLLTKLAELRQNGILTEKEFNSKKKKILSKI